MKTKTIKGLLGLTATVAVIALAGCGGVYNTDTYQAERDALYSDKPAQITCFGYGTVMFDGSSTGKVLYDDGGRVSFVDAANGRYTTVEGECRVVYALATAPSRATQTGAR
ncbi:hypothetical protein [Caulobacter sp. RHG1]|uniref:hypothetical protein n=1 Tax=Caulobacter sp. (strain RHG1) TaxID=2545762 RepID=UPI001F50ED2B|nr:hypothetical protein [Caulobacter sp. RHG1]NQE62927.1 hypothetical protein [Caulobacter sp. RHG1]